MKYAINIFEGDKEFHHSEFPIIDLITEGGLFASWAETDEAKHILPEEIEDFELENYPYFDFVPEGYEGNYRTSDILVCDTRYKAELVCCRVDKGFQYNQETVSEDIQDYKMYCSALILKDTLEENISLLLEEMGITEEDERVSVDEINKILSA